MCCYDVAFNFCSFSFTLFARTAFSLNVAFEHSTKGGALLPKHCFLSAQTQVKKLLVKQNVSQLRKRFLSSLTKFSFSLQPGFHIIVPVVRIVPVVSKKCSDDREDYMETLLRRSQTTRTTDTTSIAWIELSSIRTIETIV